MINYHENNMLVRTSDTYFATINGVIFNQDHLEVVDALRLYYLHNDENKISVRKIHDALDEKFHHKGGIKYLYKLFPNGPVAQGCQIAGLPAPTGSIDKGFGSVA